MKGIHAGESAKVRMLSRYRRPILIFLGDPISQICGGVHQQSVQSLAYLIAHGSREIVRRSVS